MTAEVDEDDFDVQSETLKETRQELINQVFQRKPSTQTQASDEAEKHTEDMASKITPSDEAGTNFEEMSSMQVQEASDARETQNQPFGSVSEQDQSQSVSEPHDQTSESLNVHQNDRADIESIDEDRHVWNETSDDATETLIGKKRQRDSDTDHEDDVVTPPFCKRAKIGDNEHSEIEAGEQAGSHSHFRKRIAGRKFTKALQQGQQIAKWLGAVCPPQESFCRSYNKAALSFECRNNHKFFLNINQISDTHAVLIDFSNQGHQEVTKELLEQIKWCGRCAKLYEKVEEICGKQKLTLLDGLHCEQMIVQCQKSGHKFGLTYKKAYNRLYFPRAHPKRLEKMTCPHCEREVKEELKEKRRQEEWEKNAPERQRQAEEIAEARKRNWAQMTQSHKQTVKKPMIQHCSKPKVQYSPEYLYKLEVAINSKARDQAALYVASDPQANFDKVSLVYKFAATPHEIIVEGMLGLGSYEAMHQYYKKLAKMLHPDKNTHELANEVFQKVTQAFQDVEPVLKKQDALKAAKKAKQTHAQPSTAHTSAYQAYFNAFNSKATVY